MPRQIPPTITFDEAEDEILFTIAALKADPDASDLVPMTDDWLGFVDTARGKDRTSRGARVTADAARIVANDRLDNACISFGDDLRIAVKKDLTATRWTQFFKIAVSKFIRQRLETQVQKVRGWLSSSDPVLDKHRAALDTWSKAADVALVQTRSVALVRGEAWIAREEMARDLTRERDGLHDALSARARERGLPREWPDLFFRVKSRSVSEEAESTPEAPPAEG